MAKFSYRNNKFRKWFKMFTNRCSIFSGHNLLFCIFQKLFSPKLTWSGRGKWVFRSHDPQYSLPPPRIVWRSDCCCSRSKLLCDRHFVWSIKACKAGDLIILELKSNLFNIVQPKRFFKKPQGNHLFYQKMSV